MSKTLGKVEKLLTEAYDLMTEYCSEIEEASERAGGLYDGLHRKSEEARLSINEAQEFLKEALEISKKVK